MGQRFRAVVDWVKQYSLWIILILIGAGTGAALLRKRGTKVTTFEAALAASRAKKRIVELREANKSLIAEDMAQANEVLRINAEITSHTRVIAELHSGKSWGALSDGEIEKALLDAGL